LNTTILFDKYFRAISEATNIAGEDLGAVRLGLKMALDDHQFANNILRGDTEYYQTLLAQQAAIAERLQGLEDRLLAWLDEHNSDLPIVLAADYEQHLADVIVEILNQQRVTILTQAEAIEGQREAIARMRQQAVQPPVLTINGSDALYINTAQHNGSAITIADPTIPADWTHGDALYVELHRLAREGAGPSKPRWDEERADGLPKANDVIASTGMRWFALLNAAGLKAPIRPNATPVETEVSPNGDATFRS
jgi:hypothetical protein